MINLHTIYLLLVLLLNLSCKKQSNQAVPMVPVTQTKSTQTSPTSTTTMKLDTINTIEKLKNDTVMLKVCNKKWINYKELKDYPTVPDTGFYMLLNDNLTYELYTESGIINTGNWYLVIVSKFNADNKLNGLYYHIHFMGANYFKANKIEIEPKYKYPDPRVYQLNLTDSTMRVINPVTAFQNDILHYGISDEYYYKYKP